MNKLLDYFLKILAPAKNWWLSLSDKMASVILDWLIVLASVILIAVIYIPRGIWAEERAATEVSRHRMTVIQNSQEFYHTITGEYALDGKYLFKMLSQVHDTLIGDTTYVGEQAFMVGQNLQQVNIPEGMGIQMDTTYSRGRPTREEVLDTTYTVVLFDAELAANDTIYLIGQRSLNTAFDDPGFREIPDTSFGSHVEVITDYTWHRFRLTEDLLVSPITGEPFILSLDSLSADLTVADPLPIDYREGRYLFFRFRPRNGGRIVGGEYSWKGP